MGHVAVCLRLAGSYSGYHPPSSASDGPPIYSSTSNSFADRASSTAAPSQGHHYPPYSYPPTTDDFTGGQMQGQPPQGQMGVPPQTPPQWGPTSAQGQQVQPRVAGGYPVSSTPGTTGSYSSSGMGGMTPGAMGPQGAAQASPYHGMYQRMTPRMPSRMDKQAYGKMQVGNRLLSLVLGISALLLIRYSQVVYQICLL